MFALFFIAAIYYLTVVIKSISFVAANTIKPYVKPVLSYLFCSFLDLFICLLVAFAIVFALAVSAYKTCKCILAAITSCFAFAVSAYKACKCIVAAVASCFEFAVSICKTCKFILAAVASGLAMIAVSTYKTSKTAFEAYHTKKQAYVAPAEQQCRAVVLWQAPAEKQYRVNVLLQAPTVQQCRLLVLSQASAEQQCRAIVLWQAPAEEQCRAIVLWQQMLQLVVWSGASACKAIIPWGSRAIQKYYTKRNTQGRLTTDKTLPGNTGLFSQTVWAEKDAVSAMCGGPSQCGERFVKRCRESIGKNLFCWESSSLCKKRKIH